MPRDREQEQIRAILDLVEKCDQARLELEVRGDTIVVMMPGTRFSVTYRMLEDPQLWSDLVLDDRDALITRAAFLARAWKAANDKARELGWIAWRPATRRPFSLDTFGQGGAAAMKSLALALMFAASAVTAATADESCKDQARESKFTGDTLKNL